MTINSTFPPLTITDPPHLYHAMSATRFNNLTDYTTIIPGLSKQHLILDYDQPILGLWITSDIGRSRSFGHGRSEELEDPKTIERMKDIVRKWQGDAAAEKIDFRKVAYPIIIEISALDVSRLFEDPMCPGDFFYEGNLPWNQVAALHVPKTDPEMVKKANEIAQLLLERGHKLEVIIYDPETMRDTSYDITYEETRENSGQKDKSINDININKIKPVPESWPKINDTRLDPEGTI